MYLFLYFHFIPPQNRTLLHLVTPLKGRKTDIFMGYVIFSRGSTIKIGIVQMFRKKRARGKNLETTSTLPGALSDCLPITGLMCSIRDDQDNRGPTRSNFLSSISQRRFVWMTVREMCKFVIVKLCPKEGPGEIPAKGDVAAGPLFEFLASVCKSLTRNAQIFKPGKVAKVYSTNKASHGETK
jgi:hypothetical protein